MSVQLFGIRHHGPGSARALARALDDLQPDVILIEGPPEADGLIGLAGSEDLQPPVALLAYPSGKAVSHRLAAYWPFAVFSPEWQAIRWAVTHRVPARFCDLPIAYQFAKQVAAPADGGEEEPAGRHRPSDPLRLLANAAGYDDAERWWEDVVEQRRDGTPPFGAIADAMGVVRAAIERDDPVGDLREQRREAYMRTVLRATVTKGYQRVAVVCGAWHVPALQEPWPPAARDSALLKGMAKLPVAMTWVPWTHGRLASWTGYGAGVTSPGWYHHLFTTTDRPVPRWMVKVAGVLRGEDLPVSSAHVIEAVRLADALAVLRDRPAPGLAEVTEAIRAVLCDGDEGRLGLIQARVVVGEQMGTVPAETPSVPLVADLAAHQKRLRLRAEALVRPLDLDLRKPNDLARSQLLHRLRLLGVDWGTPASADPTIAARGGKGTFWETWRLGWQPEYAIDLIAAGGYGTTVEAAATARVIEAVGGAATLAAVTDLVERCLLADLPAAQPVVLAALDDRVALDVDVAHLLDALPALARALRYGDVRRTGTAALQPVVAGLVVRACVGLPTALVGLDDVAAAAMRERIDATQAALALLPEASELRNRWVSTLSTVVDRDDLPGLLAGRITRLLMDEGRLDTEAVNLRMARALTVGVPPARGAAWVEGFLSGGGLLLAHDPHLLALVDHWLAGIAPENFTDVLPLLRRTFATFAPPERRLIGDRARHAGRPVTAAAPPVDDIDHARAALVLPTVALIFGTAPAAGTGPAGGMTQDAGAVPAVSGPAPPAHRIEVA
jgi:hypothetical protein